MKTSHFLMAGLLAPLLASASLASPLKGALIVPKAPVALDPAHPAKIEKAAEAQKALRKLRDSGAVKENLDQMRLLQQEIEKARGLAQGISLTLRLTNTSQKAVTVTYGGDASHHTLAITGPGALDLKFEGAMTREFRSGKPYRIRAGESVDLEIPELRYSPRDLSRWLLGKPGEYKISLQLRVPVDGQQVELETGEATLVLK